MFVISNASPGDRSARLLPGCLFACHRRTVDSGYICRSKGTPEIPSYEGRRRDGLFSRPTAFSILLWGHFGALVLI